VKDKNNSDGKQEVQEVLEKETWEPRPKSKCTSQRKQIKNKLSVFMKLF
jgi:hypothetical protein